jgi:hypothetical protein
MILKDVKIEVPNGLGYSMKVMVDGKEVENILSMEIGKIKDADDICTVKIEQFCKLGFEGKCDVEMQKTCPVRGRPLTDDEVKRIALEIQGPLMDFFRKQIRVTTGNI